MSNTTRPPAPPPFFRYKEGDIGRALAEGLRHSVTAEDIEQALYSLLFIRDEFSADIVRELLADLLNAAESTSQPTTPPEANTSH